ncbi:NAP1-related protein 2-like isoform X2 [Musa acuminata AAA Group]|uniref:NAP1-related protein 2-like isoform X2 n=1 Tax=Musa acuminata AAA Group TaxID=214697 RepID=UPI0031D4BC3E
MVADKGKKSKVADPGAEGAEPEQHIDGELVLSIEKLQEIQDELERVNEEASDKVFEVEQKYNEIRRPVFVRRAEIIQHIPDFWLTAFLSHPALGDLLTEKDQENFSNNPYFEDTKLTKTYSFNDEGTTNVTGTTIKWKDGMEHIANGDAHEKKGNKRPFAEESFFSWFSENQQKDFSEGVMDEVAEIIKEDLWPNPLKYFNNEADEEDFDGDEDDDEETDEDGEPEDDEDEE